MHWSLLHVVIGHHPHPMINVIALTQLAFITLGVVLSQILYRASGRTATSAYARVIIEQWHWLFAIPVLWIGFALIAAKVNRSPLTPRVAQRIGVCLAVGCFVFFATATFVSYR